MHFLDRDIEDQYRRPQNRRAHRRHRGNNFSSYVRDYDFSVLLLEHNKDQAKFSTPEDFGDLHGKLFRLL